MMSNRDAARAALATYEDQPGHQGNDDRESITDLIADLAHLADILGNEGEPNCSGTQVLDMAEINYSAEQED